ncbi:MAG: HNH endonuclease [Planctomycetota bacterium]|nr:HNH endonuclease [Planctomycetota bacterium]
MSEAACALCGRSGTKLTAHHLIPRSQHRRERIQKLFSKEERLSRLAPLCPPCHKQVHAVLSEQQLALSYNTIEALRNEPEIARFVVWIATKAPNTAVTVHKHNRRR